jgi:hypothetical protein
MCDIPCIAFSCALATPIAHNTPPTHSKEHNPTRPALNPALINIDTSAALQGLTPVVSL